MSDTPMKILAFETGEGLVMLEKRNPLVPNC